MVVIFVAAEFPKARETVQSANETHVALGKKWKSISEADKKVHVDESIAEEAILDGPEGLNYLSTDGFKKAATKSDAFLRENARGKDDDQEPLSLASFMQAEAKQAQSEAKTEAKRAAEFDSIVKTDAGFRAPPWRPVGVLGICCRHLLSLHCP